MNKIGRDFAITLYIDNLIIILLYYWLVNVINVPTWMTKISPWLAIWIIIPVALCSVPSQRQEFILFYFPSGGEAWLWGDSYYHHVEIIIRGKLGRHCAGRWYIARSGKLLQVLILFFSHRNSCAETHKRKLQGISPLIW